MKRAELLSHLRSLSSGTVAVLIGSDSYTEIDLVISNVIVYAAGVAPRGELSKVRTYPDILSFVSAHKDYRPARFP